MEGHNIKSSICEGRLTNVFLRSALSYIPGQNDLSLEHHFTVSTYSNINITEVSNSTLNGGNKCVTKYSYFERFLHNYKLSFM